MDQCRSTVILSGEWGGAGPEQTLIPRRIPPCHFRRHFETPTFSRTNHCCNGTESCHTRKSRIGIKSYCAIHLTTVRSPRGTKQTRGGSSEPPRVPEETSSIDVGPSPEERALLKPLFAAKSTRAQRWPERCIEGWDASVPRPHLVAGLIPASPSSRWGKAGIRFNHGMTRRRRPVSKIRWGRRAIDLCVSAPFGPSAQARRLSKSVSPTSIKHGRVIGTRTARQLHPFSFLIPSQPQAITQSVVKLDAPWRHRNALFPAHITS
jgi:hypothetical protein